MALHCVVGHPTLDPKTEKRNSGKGKQGQVTSWPGIAGRDTRNFEIREPIREGKARGTVITTHPHTQTQAAGKDGTCCQSLPFSFFLLFFLSLSLSRPHQHLPFQLSMCSFCNSISDFRPFFFFFGLVFFSPVLAHPPSTRFLLLPSRLGCGCLPCPRPDQTGLLLQ